MITMTFLFNSLELYFSLFLHLYSYIVLNIYKLDLRPNSFQQKFFLFSRSKILQSSWPKIFLYSYLDICTWETSGFQGWIDILRSSRPKILRSSTAKNPSVLMTFNQADVPMDRNPPTTCRKCSRLCFKRV